MIYSEYSLVNFTVHLDPRMQRFGHTLLTRLYIFFYSFNSTSFTAFHSCTYRSTLIFCGFKFLIFQHSNSQIFFFSKFLYSKILTCTILCPSPERSHNFIDVLFPASLKFKLYNPLFPNVHYTFNIFTQFSTVSLHKAFRRVFDMLLLPTFKYTIDIKTILS